MVMVELGSTPHLQSDVTGVEPGAAPARNAPLCWIVDNELRTRQFLSLVLNGLGIDTLEFSEDGSMWTDTENRLPQLIFLNVSEDATKAINSIILLAGRHYAGAVQLIGNREEAVLDHIKKVGIEHKLNMLPVLQKPVSADLTARTVQGLNFPLHSATAKQIDLTEALRENWIEFWFQPVVDLMRKRLASIEAFARVRHSDHGLILPAGFIEGATASSIVQLSELAILSALKVGIRFSKVGVNLPVTVNIPLDVLYKLPLEKMVCDFHANPRYWPGLIVDVAEDEIIGNLKLVDDLACRLKRINVRIAVDNFGRNELPLCSTDELQFAQIKLDRSFISRANNETGHCKTMIDVARRFGTIPVAIGIEKAADAMTMMRLGCTFGQGFLLGQPMTQERFVSLLRRRLAIESRSSRRYSGR